MRLATLDGSPRTGTGQAPGLRRDAIGLREVLYLYRKRPSTQGSVS